MIYPPLPLDGAVFQHEDNTPAASRRGSGGSLSCAALPLLCHLGRLAYGGFRNCCNSCDQLQALLLRAEFPGSDQTLREMLGEIMTGAYR